MNKLFPTALGLKVAIAISGGGSRRGGQSA